MQQDMAPLHSSFHTRTACSRPPGRGRAYKKQHINLSTIILRRIINMTDMKSEKGVPSPFPAPLQTAAAQNTAPQDTVAQNSNPQNTAPQVSVTAKTNQPAQTTASAQNVQSTQAAPLQNVQPPQTTAPAQNAQPPQAQANNTPTGSFADASAYHYLTGGGFARDMTFYSTYKNKKTGFANMDHNQPFLPGLYGIGAQPGGGKTTFSWQLANQQAYMGEYVLYFALEQTKYELVPKSLSHSSTWSTSQTQGRITGRAACLYIPVLISATATLIPHRFRIWQPFWHRILRIVFLYLTAASLIRSRISVSGSRASSAKRAGYLLSLSTTFRSQNRQAASKHWIRRAR